LSREGEGRTDLDSYQELESNAIVGDGVGTKPAALHHTHELARTEVTPCVSVGSFDRFFQWPMNNGAEPTPVECEMAAGAKLRTIPCLELHFTVVVLETSTLSKGS
jgi:hypothetical protein